MTAGTIPGLRRWTITSFLATLALCALLVGWAGTARVDSAVAAPAALALPDDAITVQHPDGGQVIEVAVTEGQSVTAGDILIRLDAQAIDEQLAAGHLTADLLRVQLARLDAQIASAELVTAPDHLNTAADAEPVASALAAAQGQLDGWRRSLDAQEEQVRIQNSTNSTARQAQIDALRAAAALDSRSERSEVLDQIAAADNEIASLTARSERTAVTAPADGVVFDLQQLQTGRVLAPGETMMMIARDGSRLVAKAQIGTADIDAVTEGSHATVQLSSLDRAVSASVTGTVVYVSPEPVTDAATGVASYRATIDLRTDELRGLPASTELVPGMPATAFVSVGEQTVLHYLVSPLVERLSTAMREP